MATYNTTFVDPLLRITMLQLSYYDILITCRTEKRAWLICRDGNFWRSKIIHDFGEEALGDPYLLPEMSYRGMYIFLLASRNEEYVPGAENFIAGDVCLALIVDDILNSNNLTLSEEEKKLRLVEYFTGVITSKKYLYPYQYRLDYRPYYVIYNYLLESIALQRSNLFNAIWNNIADVQDFASNVETYLERDMSPFNDYLRGIVDIDNIPPMIDPFYIDSIDWDDSNGSIGMVGLLKFSQIIDQLDEFTDNYNRITDEDNRYIPEYAQTQEEYRTYTFDELYVNGLWAALVLGHRQLVRFFMSKLQSNDVWSIIGRMTKQQITPKQVNELYLNMTAFTLPYMVRDNFTLPVWDGQPSDISRSWIESHYDGTFVNLIPPRDETYVSEEEYNSVINSNI